TASAGMAVALLYALGQTVRVTPVLPTAVCGAILFALGLLGLLARRPLVFRMLAAGLAIQGIVVTGVAVEYVTASSPTVSPIVWGLLSLLGLVSSVAGLHLLLTRTQDEEAARHSDDHGAP